MKRTEEQEWVVAATNTAAQILISQGRRRQLGCHRTNPQLNWADQCRLLQKALDDLRAIPID